MHTYTSAIIAVFLSLHSCSAFDVPSNVKTFYDGVKAAGSCKNALQTGFYAHNDGPNTFSYCGDHLDDYKVVYIQGTGGALADMDIDCDGLQGGPGDDGRCGSSGDTQSQTSFKDKIAGYGVSGVKDLNAFVHPYVVFGNVGSKAGFTNYDPRANGIEPLSLMAVVCGGKMFYGIWGDENGDDGPKAVIGEASISMATLCFGNSVNGNSGHDETDVLYIAFTGPDAVPGAKGAKWNAASAEEFQSSIKTFGDKLVNRIGVAGPAPSTGVTTLKKVPRPTSTTRSVKTLSPKPASCSWTGHCSGVSCSSEDDCSDDLTCINGKCGSAV
ncbi:Endo-chitosanase [Venustampulla echinocandica]|uniref:Endo-chitosanase n=1 Tax=Venustampulla echinocandica TaxID=2656787 RepID=A0A370TWK9_9HELO|nr:Endo-chitosanase [Venustampulla echinocandica]RDL39916.1 Endo-chitosanase [Venustampulla echinocandica]